MFKNYMIVAFRNFSRNKIFSLINIAGLAIGISASLVIYLIAHYELSFEKFQKDNKQIYRIVTDMHFPGQDFKNSGVPGPLPAAVRAEIPGIEKSTVFWREGEMKVAIPNNFQIQKRLGYQKEIVFADDQYFQFFHYQWLAGSPDRALTEPNQVVLTESRAKTYFPGVDVKNVLDQNISYNDSVNATVVGVVKDLDQVTDFTFKDFISLSTISEKLKRNNEWDKWGSVSNSTQFFVKLQKGADTARINKQIAAVRKKYEEDAYLATDHFLQPLNDIHFNPNYDAFQNRQGHLPTLYGLLAVAVFLLVLGCINFINLTTAQATQRAKEIGIRKTMGSSKVQLVFQFLSETVFLTAIAAVVSILLTPWLLHVFSAYIPPNLRLDILHQPDVFSFIVALVLVVSVLSGFYPALVLSGYKPVLVLKNLAYANTSQSRRAWLRKTLTITQFVIAQFFIIATMVVGKQIRFSLNKDMGFKKNAIIYFQVPPNTPDSDNKKFVLQEKLKSIPGIVEMSLSGFPPAFSGVNISTLKAIDKSGKELETSVQIGLADTAFFDLYKIKLVAGSRLQQSDTLKEFLVNENYAKLLGYQNTSEIIGKELKGKKTAAVIGVIPDIHTTSLHESIHPLAYCCIAKAHRFFHIALPGNNGNTENWQNTIAAIGSAFKQIYPDEQFEYEFVDESIAKFYKREQDTASLLNWCTGLAIFISCLGLLGLVIFTTAQRTKEIGVRKVLGASVSQIVSLLSKDFISLVLIAFLIASPIAWWTMHNWLQDFAYRTPFSWWIFGLSGLAMIIVALLTLSIKTVRSALANPVKSLRTE